MLIILFVQELSLKEWLRKYLALTSFMFLASFKLNKFEFLLSLVGFYCYFFQLKKKMITRCSNNISHPMPCTR